MYNPDIANFGNGVVITLNGQQHTDTTNHPDDPAVRISVQRDVPNFKLTAAVVGGAEHDCVYGYAVVNGHCFRSPCWQDTTPGVLNLQGVDWTNENSFKIAGRGVATFDGAQTWTVDLGSGAQYGDGGVTTTQTVF
jgi:hypothetical protein